MVLESVILLGVQHLQQRGSRVTAKILRHLVYFIKQKQRVAALDLGQVLDDLARHGAYIGAPVAPDLRLITHTAQGHTDKLAIGRPGYRLPVFETTFGQIGILIGWDLAFPEAARSLALDGAELLCVCANWGHAPAQERVASVEEWRTYTQARASENALYVVASNRIGEEYSYHFFGESMVAGPRGEIYASIDEEIEGYALATIDLDAVRKTREELQLMQCRVPQAYRAIVRKY